MGTAPPKIITCITHARSCSSAFERIFMNHRDIETCLHEDFGEAFFIGPEAISPMFKNQDGDIKISSLFKDNGGNWNWPQKNVTFKSTMDDILDKHRKTAEQGKRTFFKEIANHLVPLPGDPATIAPSFNEEAAVYTREPSNPTVIPAAFYNHLHTTFLIRHPQDAIPSFFRISLPPRKARTGQDAFNPNDISYGPVRALLDFMLARNLTGSGLSGQDEESTRAAANVILVDADDLLDDPQGIISAYCEAVGLEFYSELLDFGSKESQVKAEQTFRKYDGWHDDALNSSSLRPRDRSQRSRTREEDDVKWREEFGEEAAKVIRQSVDDSMADYEHLKAFRIKASKKGSLGGSPEEESTPVMDSA